MEMNENIEKEEIEKRKGEKIEGDKEERKKNIFLNYIQANSLREIVDQVNAFNAHYPDEAVRKEDIVTLMKEEGTFVLLYFTHDNGY